MGLASRLRSLSSSRLSATSSARVDARARKPAFKNLGRGLF
jgi:hypothetical protein